MLNNKQKLLVQIEGNDENGKKKTINLKLPSINNWKNNLDFLNKKIIKKYSTNNEYGLEITGRTINCNDYQAFAVAMSSFNLTEKPYIKIVNYNDINNWSITGRQIVVHYGNNDKFIFSVADDLSELDDGTYDNLIRGIRRHFNIKERLGKESIYEDAGGSKIYVDDWDDLSDCLADKEDDEVLHLWLAIQEHSDDDEKDDFMEDSDIDIVPNIDIDNDEYPVLPLIIPNNCTYDPITKQMTVHNDQPRNKLVVRQETLDFIRSINAKVATISIVGRARTGKSLVAGELYAPGIIPCPFDLGHKMDACTYGIWVSAKTIKHPHEDDTVILIFDVEGTGFHQAKKQNDLQIMVVTLLISSYFIYNTKGSFDAPALDEIKFITELTEQIESTPNSKDGQDFKKFFPKFMWLLRDAHLEPTINNKRVPVRDYFTEKVLKHEAGFSRDVREREWIRAAFLQMFQKYDAFALPMPHANKKKLQQLGTIKRSKLEPEFNNGLRKFYDIVMRDTRVKTLYLRQNDRDYYEYCTGPHLAVYIEKCTEAVNDADKIPQVASMSIESMESVYRTAKNAAITAYKKLLSNGLKKLRNNDDKQPLDEHDIVELHIAIFNDVLNGIGSSLQCIDDDEKCESAINRKQFKIYKEFCDEIGHNDKYINQIGKNGGIMHDALLYNNQLSITYNDSYLENGYKKSIEPMFSNQNIEKCQVEDIFAKFTELETMFYAQCKGPAKDECWKQFKSKKMDESIQRFKTIKTLNDKILMQQQQNDEQREKFEKLQRKSEQQDNEIALQKKHMQNEIARMEKKAKDEAAKQTKLHQQHLQQETKRLTDLHNAQFNTLKSTVNQQMETMKKSQTQQLNALKQQHAQTMKQQKESMEKTINELKNRSIYHPYPNMYYGIHQTRFSFNYTDTNHCQISEGGTRITSRGKGCPYVSVASNCGWRSGIYTWAIRSNGSAPGYNVVGVCTNYAPATQYNRTIGGLGTVATFSSFTTNDIVTVTLDLMTWKVFFLKNGALVSTCDLKVKNATYYPCLQMCGCRGHDYKLL